MNNTWNKYIAFILVAGTSVAGPLVFAHSPLPDTNPAASRNEAAVCVPGKGEFRCHAHVVVDKGGNPSVSSSPGGYGPKDFHGAYVAATTVASNKVIAVVDAYDHPNILSDVSTYSSTFGIPTLPACVGPIVSSGIPCFQKVNQRGGTSYPQSNAGWDLEIALDVEVAHAMCQNCRILLVEADSNSYANLFAAVDEASVLGANVISNSYGSAEFSGETAYDAHLNHSGIAMTFSSGDSGYGTEYPAASPYVTAVGGTTLSLNSDKSWKQETVWSGAGSGCSSLESKPAWQSDPLCPRRTIADVSADADPATGAAVYDSIRYQGVKGWFEVGGTSLASPLIAGVYALAGGVQPGVFGNALPYAFPSGLHDVTSGSNGSCGGSYLCTGVTGYDGPTGLGTPNGLSSF